VPDALQAAGIASSTPPRRESGAAESDAGPFDRIAFRDVPLAILAGAAMLAMVAGPGWTEASGPWVWIVSLVLVGLPHGAADVAIGRWLAGRSIRDLVLGGLLYLGGMACVAAAFAVAPAATILLFSLVSIWHFGIGHHDTEPGNVAAATRRGGAGWTLPAEAARAMARAGVVLGMPAAAWPERTAAVADRLVELLHSQAASHGPLFDPSSVRNAGWALLAASAVAVVGESVGPRGRVPGWLLAECGVFAAVGWFADPLFSVGLYYLCWHAWRHLRSVMPERGTRSLAASVFRLHLEGLPLLLPTLAALGGLWWLLSPGHSPRDLAILSIGVYLVVTPSHDVLVRRFRDRRERDESR
jgi:Brp/Blh family beta-carotene 15,15'-monooxygenase